VGVWNLATGRVEQREYTLELQNLTRDFAMECIRNKLFLGQHLESEWYKKNMNKDKDKIESEIEPRILGCCCTMFMQILDGLQDSTSDKEKNMIIKMLNQFT
jgi:hypothetical protein